VAVELGALIIDGGTQSGVMAMMGEAVARSPGTSQLLGIAPQGKIAHPQISGASAVSDSAGQGACGGNRRAAHGRHSA